MLEANYIVNYYDNNNKFLGFETFPTNKQAIEYSDMCLKYRIFKKSFTGVHEIEKYGF